MWLVYIPTSSIVLEETARKKEEGFFSFDVATSKEVVYKETCSSLINAPMEHQNPFFWWDLQHASSGSRPHLSWYTLLPASVQTVYRQECYG